jgi:hypothetical protein
MNIRRIVITGAAALALVAGGTAAGATIAAGPVDGSGVIHGCYDSGGNVKVIDASATCPKGYTALNWSQQGPAGPQGAKGDTGATGPQGPKGDPGKDGTNGTNGKDAAPEFTWTVSCPADNEFCAVDSATSLPAGTVVIPVSAHVTGADCPFAADSGITGGGDVLAAVTRPDGSMTVSGPQTIIPFKGDGSLKAEFDCGPVTSHMPYTVTFIFNETQPFS